ncbi:hypothetical protein [Streptacidiphilus sp. EB129]|uniref:hypothetical protein n=1 Tax=Streptacidiphilus sp. EB129 TaxID=3156262 RepID=UPI003518A1E5
MKEPVPDLLPLGDCEPAWVQATRDLGDSRPPWPDDPVRRDIHSLRDIDHYIDQHQEHQ